VAADQVWATIVVLDPGDTEITTWVFTGDGVPGLAALDALARIALAARREGCAVRVRDACRELTELVDLAGLGVEMFGQAECGKEVGVEEIVLPDDPVA
jgi:hypothetical protein